MSKSDPKPDAQCNGIDVAALRDVAAVIASDPAKGAARFNVRTLWEGATRSRSTVNGYELGGQLIERRFEIETDEPLELLGGNSAPNPQELLMAAVNACMTVGYVANAAMMGVTLSHLEIELEGMLDLRGFLGLSDDIPAGYRSLEYTVRISGDGTPEQFTSIHEAVMRTSPNYFNMVQPISMNGRLDIR
ncbi:OsmC family protein [Rhizobium halophilum]|uniref:OsmC family protein n=1 Tax=Rhizobium halophilum TaxID=2846852 RepID=UPI001EFD38BC|nr:OsmC family protein [Rhizobium halophilum]MCF6371370.1 OsmC family protein [Rhizobium halophilum]